MADQVKKVILIHHTEIEKSQKFLSAVKLILLDILNSKAESLCVKSVKAHFNYEIMMNDEELLKKLRSPEVSDFFEVTGSIEKMKDADIVLTGASTHQGFLTPDHFKLNSVIVDVAVPANIKEEVLLELRSNRPDVHYLLGGIAKLPREQSIDTEIFILNEGESYACMAETFILTFSGREDLLHIGNLSKSMVEAVNEMAEKSGFDLAGFKLKTSIL
jgi:predicted amino acid dehydrogenase